MSKRSVDAAQFRTYFAPLCDAEAVELVDARLTTDSDGAVLRVLIDVPNAETLPPGSGGVTLDHCTRVSRALSAWLDEHEDLIPGTFRLEVSSPGVERPLVLLSDFERFKNRDVRIQLRAPVGQRKKTVSGHLLGVRDADIVLRDEHGEELTLPHAEVSRAQLVYRF
jgi:ribosome maturation factor RimP